MTDSTVRFGLLGAGRDHALAMVTPAREVDGVSLDVIAARDPARAQEFAEMHGIHRVSEHYCQELMTLISMLFTLPCQFRHMLSGPSQRWEQGSMCSVRNRSAKTQVKQSE